MGYKITDKKVKYNREWGNTCAASLVGSRIRINLTREISYIWMRLPGCKRTLGNKKGFTFNTLIFYMYDYYKNNGWILELKLNEHLFKYILNGI